jgi:hypothetical protein
MDSGANHRKSVSILDVDGCPMDKLNSVYSAPIRPRPVDFTPKPVESRSPQLPGETFSFSQPSSAVVEHFATPSPAPENSLPVLPEDVQSGLPVQPKGVAKSFETSMVILDEPSLSPASHDDGPGIGSFADWSRKAGGYDVAAQSMRSLEKEYLAKFPYQDGQLSVKLQGELNGRYGDYRSSKDRVHESISNFAEARGISMDCPAEINSKALFNAASAEQLKESLVTLADQFFDNPNASQNPLKARLARQEANRFIDLLVEVQKEGSLPPQGSVGLTNGKVHQLMARNLGALAIQDEAASEAFLGDHGIRHLVGHNIQVCETVADKLVETGTKVSAKDRLILHQAMIMHDLGYSTQNVRGAFEHDGLQGQDAGHPVISGKYMRELTADAQDPVGLIFSAEDMQLMHRCVLYHDKDANGGAGLDFRKTSKPSFDDRRANLESLTRVADNSHAFEDKLPELIYRHPKSLSVLRLAQTAKELGMEDLHSGLLADLGHQIQGRSDLSARDKKAMETALNQAGNSDVSYSVKRILGNRPSFDVNSDGKLQVTIQEAPVHHRVSAAFGQADYSLLGNYIQEIGGQKPGTLKNGESTIQTPQIDFKLKLGSQKATSFTEFQSQLQQSFESDTAFKQWAVEENCLRKVSLAVSSLIKGAKSLDDSSLAALANKFVDLGDTPRTRENVLSALGQRTEELKAERKSQLSQYLETTKPAA